LTSSTCKLAASFSIVELGGIGFFLVFWPIVWKSRGEGRSGCQTNLFCVFWLDVPKRIGWGVPKFAGVTIGFFCLAFCVNQKFPGSSPLSKRPLRPRKFWVLPLPPLKIWFSRKKNGPPQIRFFVGGWVGGGPKWGGVLILPGDSVYIWATDRGSKEGCFCFF